MYLQVALKSNKYKLTKLDAFLLKIYKLIIHNDMVIGAIVKSIDEDKTISTELMFIKPTPFKSIGEELKYLKKELGVFKSKVNAKAILCFPMDSECFDYEDYQDIATTWLVNPLHPPDIHPTKCKLSMREKYDMGIYTMEIYQMLAQIIFDVWKNEPSTELVTFIISRLKKMGSPPFLQSKIDRLIDESLKEFPQYDSTILRVTFDHIFEVVNTVDKNANDAIERIKKEPSFVGFGLKNVHRLNAKEIKDKVEKLVKATTVPTSSYPSLNPELTVVDQLDRFYDSKRGKLLIHSELRSDLIDMIVADLSNPFRREYIINSRFIEKLALVNLIPHQGELIYIQPIKS